VFQTLTEQDGRDDRSTLSSHIFHAGDALFFVSHKPHCISQLTKGSRKVLVLEFWRGIECRCGHRCDDITTGGRSCDFVDDDEC
jgi:hypothetical protein